MSSLWSPRYVARHEAGHALVAAAEGVPIVEVRIWRPGGGSHACGHALLVLDAPGVSLEARVKALLAGGEAERVVSGATKREIEVTATSDRLAARDLLHHDPEAFKWFAKRTRKLIEVWPEAVDAIADDLLRRGVLTGAEIASITGLSVAA